MRIFSLTIVLAVSSTCVPAATLPVGTYTLSGHTSTTGVHQSIDQGTMSGTLSFDTSSIVTSADLTFYDMTSGMSFTFTNVGPTDINTGAHTESALITNSVDPNIEYFFSIIIPGLANGSFSLGCGVDCQTDAEIPNGGVFLNEELTGVISPTPEPDSLLLLGTGVLGAAGAFRRRILQG